MCCVWIYSRRSSISRSLVWWWHRLGAGGPTYTSLRHMYTLDEAMAARASGRGGKEGGYRDDVIDWPSISRLPSWLPPSRSLSSHIHRVPLSISPGLPAGLSPLFSLPVARSPSLFTPRAPPSIMLRDPILTHPAASNSPANTAEQNRGERRKRVGAADDNNCFSLYNSTHRSFRDGKETIGIVTNIVVLNTAAEENKK